MTLGAVALLLGRNNGWVDVKKMMANHRGFFDELINFDSDSVKLSILEKITNEYYNDPKFTPENVYQCSRLGGTLCTWVHALVEYNQVSKAYKDKLAMQNETHGQQEAETDKVLAQLEEAKDGIRKLNRCYFTEIKCIAKPP